MAILQRHSSDGETLNFEEFYRALMGHGLWLEVQPGKHPVPALKVE